MCTKIFILIFIAVCESKSKKNRDQFKLSCPTECWPNQIASCNSQGERERTYKYNLPHLDTIGLEYHALDFMTTIRAKFDHLILKVGNLKKLDTYLVLNTYEITEDWKEYSKTFGFTALCDNHESTKCEQTASINVTLKIYNGGAVILELGVNAASYNAETCATVKVCLESFTITNRNLYKK